MTKVLSIHKNQRLYTVDYAYICIQSCCEPIIMIRKFLAKDKSDVIALLHHNIPLYFAPSEEKDFIAYLDNQIEDYFVVEKNNLIVGAGGINYHPKEGKAQISWDMIHPDYHGQGIGKKLVTYRIDYIKKHSNAHCIYVKTSQLVYPFYKKLGFGIEKTEKDYWAKGYDLYLMKMIIQH